MARARGEVGPEVLGPRPSRGRGAAEVLAERKAAAASAAAEPASTPPAPPPPAPNKAPAKAEPGGFRRGVREGAAQGRRMAPRQVAGRSVNDGAGVLLGFLLWVWVALPYTAGGTPRVADVLRAKLTNKGRDGKALK